MQSLHKRFGRERGVGIPERLGDKGKLWGNRIRSSKKKEKQKPIQKMGE